MWVKAGDYSGGVTVVSLRVVHHTHDADGAEQEHDNITGIIKTHAIIITNE